MLQELNIMIGFVLAFLMLVSIVFVFQVFQKNLSAANKLYKEKYCQKIHAVNNIFHTPSRVVSQATSQVASHALTNESNTQQIQTSLSSQNSPHILQHYKQQAEQFRAIFESTPECVKLQSKDGKIERLNKAGLKLLETKLLPNVIGHSIYDFIVKKYHPAYQKMSELVFNGEQSILEYEMLTFLGNRRWMRTTAVPLRNSEQQVTHLIAITHDITENKQLSQQLETHRNQLQTIIESEPECVKLQDASGVIMEMNPAGLSLLDAKNNEDVIGKKVYDFIATEYKDEYRALTALVFEGGRGSMEFEVLSMDGRRRWLETHAAPLFDNTGKVSALLAITRDIDGRKKNEASLRQQQTELARVCRLSTMGEMASSLAHELNQPLCAVSSYAESARLLHGSENAELDELLEKIVRQSWRATQIIQNMRDFVRKQTPTPVSISAESIIKSVVDFIEPDRRREMVQINLKIAPSISLINADRVQIEQVLLNLFSNAIQALSKLEKQERSMEVEVSQSSKEEIIFKVSNAGPGIKEGIAKELFTPFFTTKDTGLGMGLPISRSIVEAHGGRIWYKSQENDSPCFCFTLPTIENE